MPSVRSAFVPSLLPMNSMLPSAAIHCCVELSPRACAATMLMLCCHDAWAEPLANKLCTASRRWPPPTARAPPTHTRVGPCTAATWRASVVVWLPLHRILSTPAQQLHMDKRRTGQRPFQAATTYSQCLVHLQRTLGPTTAPSAHAMR
jgi:hypothetical protein